MPLGGCFSGGFVVGVDKEGALMGNVFEIAIEGALGGTLIGREAMVFSTEIGFGQGVDLGHGLGLGQGGDLGHEGALQIEAL